MENRIQLERRGRDPGKITELNLDNCKCTAVSGLTSEFENLKVLSLINAGLTSLKGLPVLPSLCKLELSDNRISGGLNALASMPKLTHLNLSGNQIKDLEVLQPLKEIKTLVNLDLLNNKVTYIDNYRESMFSLIPSLVYLDGYDKEDNSEDDEEEEEDVLGEDAEDGVVDLEDGEGEEDMVEEEEEDDIGKEEEDEDDIGEEEEEEDDDPLGEDDEGDEDVPLGALYQEYNPEGDNDYEAVGDEEDEDIKEEEEEEGLDNGEGTRGEKRKHEDEETADK